MSDQRLVLDAARCDGHGICALRCPDRVFLDQWGYAAVDPTPLEGRRMNRRARNVVAACPNGALAIASVTGGAAAKPASHTGGPDVRGGGR
jgi:ferredoxin